MSTPLIVDSARNVIVKMVSPDEIIDLRHRMLRAGLPRDSAKFLTDTIHNTWHIAAFHRPAHHEADDVVVSCASFMYEMYKQETAWRLRGMCTDKHYEKRGLGTLLLETAVAHIRTLTPHVHLLWCDARVSAIGFYEKLGWIVDSDEFEIPTAGPHKKMYKRIS